MLKFKKFLGVCLALAVFLALPGAALAGNLTYSSEQDITTNGVTFKVESGSTADTLVVDTTTITVTVAAGDTFKVKDTDTTRLMRFTVDGAYTSICAQAESYVGLAPSVTTSYVIRPDPSNLCTASGGGGGGSSGGGGGSSPSTPAPAPSSPSPTTPAPTTPAPTTPAPTTNQPPAGAHPNGTLINDNGTIYLVVNGKKRGFRNPEEYFSHGYKFNQAVPATSVDSALPAEAQPVQKALDGTLVLDKSDGRTIYMIADGKKRGFVSAEVFHALGYQFSQALPIDLTDYEAGSAVDSALTAHPDGALVLEQNGTVWWILGGTRKGFQSAEVFYTYGFKFDQVVSANSADLALAEGSVVKFRDGTLVKDGDTYYLISEGLKRPFASLAGLIQLGFNADNVISASLSSYTAGDQVN